MKVISTNKQFETLLLKLIDNYDEINISVAWSSAHTKVFEALLENRSKLAMSTIGTHFYQTDPNVLDSFIDSERVRFITQPGGVFHPKVYFFSNDEKWEAIIGSANMTKGALSKNQEMSLHISNADSPSEKVKEDLLKNIKSYFESANPVSSEDANYYRGMWDKQRRNLKKVSGIYGKSKTGKAPIKSQIMRMSWSEYSAMVKEDPYHGIDKRLQLLETLQNGFDEYEEYKDMPLALRKAIAGLPNDEYSHWGWFGSMKGAGVFHKNINDNNIRISDALNQIKFNRDISKTDYMKFIEIYVQAFPDGRDGIATASRLLAMKRPDIFVCIDSKNNAQMCEDFGIQKTGMTYERYWDELICRIHDSVWWQSDEPEDETENTIWWYRAALLDCIFYEHG